MRLSRKALYQCHNCSLIFLHPPVPKAALEKSYSQAYEVAGFSVQQIRQIQLSKLRETCFNRDRDINLLLEFRRSGRILDLGCSWGFLMLQARDKGFMVKGVEVCRPYAEYARECLGLDIFIGQLHEASYPDRHFDAIVASHVLEHVPDLRRTMAEMHRILNDDGIAIIISPNFNSLSRNILGSKWKWLEPDWHLFQFTKGFFHTY
ncbi:MAG: class I SAM-dependent methyltransferase [bacterium]